MAEMSCAPRCQIKQNLSRWIGLTINLKLIGPICVCRSSAYVSNWQGWQYVAFVIDVFAMRFVGWRVSSSTQTDFVLDALEQA